MSDSTDSVLSLAVQIIAAHVANNRVDPADLPKLINDVLIGRCGPIHSCGYYELGCQRAYSRLDVSPGSENPLNSIEIIGPEKNSWKLASFPEISAMTRSISNP